MKKVLLIGTAIVMVLSGVAAVSAYEAHVVNVTAHVENAIETSLAVGETTEFGTVFPQEWHKAHVTVELSLSAIEELADEVNPLTSVNITLYAEWKEVPVDAQGDPIQPLAAYHMINTTKYYPWLGEALWVGTGVGYDRPDDLLGDPAVADNAAELAAYIAAHPGVLGVGYLAWVGPAPVSPAMAVSTGHTFTLDASTTDILVGIGLDVPVFDGFYNPATDPVPKPSWRDDPSWIIYDTDTEQYFPHGENAAGDPAIMGIDLKFQVTAITR